MARGEPALKAPDNEARLAIEAAQKDPRRFAELYEENFERVYAFVGVRVRDRHEAEDLTSEVFHRALKNLPRFEWRGVSFAAWLFKIATNAIIDRAKRAAKSREPLELEIDIADPAGDTLEGAHERARLFRLVDGLPADQRRVIVMRFAGQKTIREIAQEIRRSEGAVKQLQLRALQNLRARLSKENG